MFCVLILLVTKWCSLLFIQKPAHSLPSLSGLPLRWGFVSGGKSWIGWEDKEASEDTLLLEAMAPLYMGYLRRYTGWRGEQQRGGGAARSGGCHPVQIQHCCVPGGRRRNCHCHPLLWPTWHDLPVNYWPLNPSEKGPRSACWYRRVWQHAICFPRSCLKSSERKWGREKKREGTVLGTQTLIICKHLTS